MKAPSLRRRAALVAAVVCAGVMALGGGAAWWWMRATWLSTFEQAMHERANALGLQVELDDHEELITGGPSFSGRPKESFMIWNSEGHLLHASEGIRGLGFQRQLQEGWQFTDQGTFRTVWVRVHIGWMDEENDDEDSVSKHDKNRRDKEREGDEKKRFSEDENERGRKFERGEENNTQNLTEGKSDDREWVLVALAWDANGLYRSLTTLAMVLAGHLIMAALVGAAALWYVLGVTLRPVTTLARTIDGIQPGALSPALMVLELPSEIRPVAERVDALVQRLHEAMERERAFSGAVAHELRTPLAGLRAQLERWRQQATDTPGTVASVTCHEIVLHLQALVEKLLLLTRVQSGQLQQERLPVDLVGLVEACWEHHAVQAQRRSLQVTIELEDCPPVDSDRDLLRRIIDNVLHNAVVHADDHGSLHLSIRTETRQNHSVLVMCCDNSGCRLPAGDVFYATNRFWRGDAARSGDGLHCGLGLSVCVELAKFLNVEFKVVATAEHHFVATMAVPCRTKTTQEALN